MALPLEGVRVLDLSSVMAGPYCTMVLGDMGAAVLKIENFPGGDASRRFDPKVNDESYCFAVLNRNKKSVGLNMKNARGKGIFMQLRRGTSNSCTSRASFNHRYRDKAKAQVTAGVSAE